MREKCRLEMSKCNQMQIGARARILETTKNARGQRTPLGHGHNDVRVSLLVCNLSM